MCVDPCAGFVSYNFSGKEINYNAHIANKFSKNDNLNKERMPKKKDIRHRHKSSCLKMVGTIEKLKRAMRDEFQHAKK